MPGAFTSIIVPAWRSGSPLPVASLVRSLVATVSGSWELIVVCNGQDAALVEYVRSERAITRAAFLTQNAGVAPGWNVGAHLALGDVLVFANEDVVLGPDCIDNLAAALRQDLSLGIVGPRGARWEFGPASARHVNYVSGDGLVPCDVVSGFLFAVRRDTLRAAGYFDDNYAPCSCEEIDMAMAIRRLGLSARAFGGLRYEHEWGVSAWEPERQVEWMGGCERTSDIALRNQARLVRKWSAPQQPARFDGTYYGHEYFGRHQYAETMTCARTIDGHVEPPLATTMADVVEATGLAPRGGRILDVGCSYGFLVAELVGRGYDAYGIDFSEQAIRDSPVRDRLRQENALEMRTDERYDAVVAADIFEHLNDVEARILLQRIGAVSDALVAIINKSRHEPSHVNIKSNRRWLSLFSDCGFGLEHGATARGRACYLRKSAGTEMWHVNLLALSKRAHTSGRRALTRVIGDGAPFWRATGVATAAGRRLRRTRNTES